MKVGDYIVVILIALSGILIFKLSKDKAKLVERIEDFRPDTIILSDTIYDTVKVYKPKYLDRLIIDTLYIPCEEDSVVTIEIEQKQYSDSAYKAWVSGFMVSLDSIEIYNKIIRDTIQITKPMIKKGLWLSINNNRYIGIGLVKE